jgi:hypothetical protein
MKLKRGVFGLFVAVLTLSFTCSVMAQRGGGGQGLSPEKRDAAWSIEAGGVADGLKLSAEKAAKLTAAYKAARTSQGAAMQELRATAERGPGMFQEMQALNEAELSKLKKSLEGDLSADEITGALASLGTFSAQWDRLVDVFASFGLTGDKSSKGLALINKYVVDSDKARAEAMANMDFQSMRGAMQTLKGELDTAIGGVVSAEQLTEWKEKTAQRGRGGRGGGGRPQ